MSIFYRQIINFLSFLLLSGTTCNRIIHNMIIIGGLITRLHVASPRDPIINMVKYNITPIVLFGADPNH